MDQSMVDKITNLEPYKQLTQQRSRLAWQLSAIMLVAYYGFILLIAFQPEFFETIVFGETITIGFPIGIGLIFLAFILTGFYVRRANSVFDDLTQQIKDEVK